MNREVRRDGWAAHADEQRSAWLRLTPAERLAWLEQAKEFAARAREATRGEIPETASGALDSER